MTPTAKPKASASAAAVAADGDNKNNGDGTNNFVDLDDLVGVVQVHHVSEAEPDRANV